VFRLYVYFHTELTHFGLLELGTGTGLGTAWLLSGIDAAARLDTVDTDADHVMDGAEFIRQAAHGTFDLIYADAWPGKYSHLDEALSLLRVGGIYLIDDLLPQSNWPEGHAAKVPLLVEALERRAEFVSVRLAWASGLMLVVRSGVA
jgi:predicted O-methyltransferase YrrM